MTRTRTLALAAAVLAASALTACRPAYSFGAPERVRHPLHVPCALKIRHPRHHPCAGAK